MANQIRILLTLDGKQYEADLSGATAKTKQFGQEAERAGSKGTLLASALRSIGVGLTGFTAVQAIKQISQTGIAFEQMRLSLASISAGSGEAEQRFQFVANEAQRLGVDIETAVQGYTRLAAATRGTNLEGEATEKIFSAVSEASARLSLSTADAAGVMRALAQIASKGTLSAEELRQQLGDRLPGAFQIAADAMGVTTAKLNDMLQKGEIASEDFLPKFADAMRRSFGTDATTRINSTQASFSRLTSQIKLMVDVIAQEMNPTLAAAADFAANMLERARRARAITPETIDSMSDAELAEFGFGPRRPGPGAGIDAPFTTPGAGLVARYTGQFGPQTPTAPEPEFYGYSPPPALDEKQEERVALLREEIALMGMRTEEEKAYYQITEGRYRNETRQAKELIVAIAKETDEKKRLTEAEKAAKKAAEDEERTMRRLRDTYAPAAEAARQLALDVQAVEQRFAQGKITLREYIDLVNGLTKAHEGLTESTRSTSRAQQDLQLAYVQVAEEGLGVLRQAADESRGTQLALLALEKTLAIARILINTEIAASRAIADDPVAGQVYAAEIRALGYVSMGLVAAAGAIEAGQISGRERGGSVRSGGIYEVGERGRPELLESGGRFYLLPGNQSGQVSPARSGAVGGTIVQIHNSTGAPARTEKSRSSDGREIVRVFIGEAARDLAENGQLARSISQTFGLQRRAISR
jgi:tape measure domain-containing protein